MSKLQRTWSLKDAQIMRSEDSESRPIFRGHASVFEQPTLIGSKSYGFVEQINRGAFEDVLSNDVRLLINHAGLPLARTTNGTLRLKEDNFGLYNEADIADTTEGRDITYLLDREDVNQQSFSFTISEEKWSTREFEGVQLDFREILKVERLFDTSIVTFPAYEGAIAGMRSENVSQDEVKEALKNLRSEETLSKELEQKKLEDLNKTKNRQRLLRLKSFNYN